MCPNDNGGGASFAYYNCHQNATTIDSPSRKQNKSCSGINEGDCSYDAMPKECLTIEIEDMTKLSDNDYLELNPVPNQMKKIVMLLHRRGCKFLLC